MEGIKFGEYHSYNDFGMILTSGVKIGSPKIKKYSVDVPGCDGEPDFTEYFGRVVYGNRSLEYPFICECDPSEVYEKYSDICAKLHGKKVKIVPDDDKDFYYIGRLSVSEWQNKSVIGKLTITCDCEPYKYKKDETLVSLSVSDTKTVVCVNLKRRVCPVFTSDAEVTVSFGSISHAVNGSEQMFTDIIFDEGDNQLTIKGTGNIQIRYQEATI